MIQAENNKLKQLWDDLPKFGLAGVIAQLAAMVVANHPLNYLLQIGIIVALLTIGYVGVFHEGRTDTHRRYNGTVTRLIYLLVIVAIFANLIAVVATLPVEVETGAGRVGLFVIGLLILPMMGAGQPLLNAGRWFGLRRLNARQS